MKFAFVPVFCSEMVMIRQAEKKTKTVKNA